MKLLDFLSKYWSQISVVVFAIGYIIKIFFDFYLKQKEIKYNYIHGKRVKVIMNLYAQLNELNQQIEKMALAHELTEVNAGPTNTERWEVFNKIINLNSNLKKEFEKHKLYFSKRFINQFEKHFKKVSDNFIMTSVNINPIVKDKDKEFVFSNSKKILHYFKWQYPLLKHRLEREFKKYL